MTLIFIFETHILQNITQFIAEIARRKEMNTLKIVWKLEASICCDLPCRNLV